jgi:signal peptidase I
MDDFPRRPEPDESRASGDANLALASYGSIDTADHGIELPAVTEAECDGPGAPVLVPSGILSADSPVTASERVSDAAAASLQAETATTAQEMPAPLVRVSAWRRIVAELTAGVQTLFSAAVYATLIVTFGFQVARVDGLSMAPTLEDHDRLIVNKLVYEIGNPRPGDIVMLYYPLNPDKMFVKRVIASEGDVVRIVDGRVYVNDIPLHDDYVPEEFRSHDDWGPTVIQQGYYFVMGDHRNNSSDSRHWGQVPKKYIVGKVKVRWWPLQDARIF